MVLQADSIRAVEDLLRGHGVTITPVAPQQENVEDLQTADGRFTIAPAQNLSNQNRITLYRTDNSEAVPTDINESIKRIKKRYPTTGDFAAIYPQLAGRYAFTLGVKNEVTGKYEAPVPILPQDPIGELCWLHPQSAKFPYTRSLGVRSQCRYRGLWLPINLKTHIQMKHGGVWPLIEDDERKRREDEEREQRRSADERIQKLLELVLNSQGVPAVLQPKDAVLSSGTMTCECGEPYKPQGKGFHERGKQHQRWLMKR